MDSRGGDVTYTLKITDAIDNEITMGPSHARRAGQWDLAVDCANSALREWPAGHSNVRTAGLGRGDGQCMTCGAEMGALFGVQAHVGCLRRDKGGKAGHVAGSTPPALSSDFRAIK